ncbi:hypothetical protein A2U01_0060361, partial [Trifolium medium]|nr:hypothetical protein [Trifolium medium]
VWDSKKSKPSKALIDRVSIVRGIFEGTEEFTGQVAIEMPNVTVAQMSGKSWSDISLSNSSSKRIL